VTEIPYHQTVSSKIKVQLSLQKHRNCLY